ncbi:MarR family winged helix-turn-helix transcriptional regulator [Rhodovibrio sodomensis]|uniref:MarR family winged helix-turn-helix transcriptional regulator n=1 Tax=Rhodovibrio sodomensis TaxID=1088 RepID=UPI00190646DB|nr:MarR family transcriptional regulator [Rhodovibrio sodomensis]
MAAALQHLARLSEPEAGGAGLTANQWTALRYFAEANRFSRTVSGFAAYNATTRGTASQTVKALVAQGYVSRTRLDRDARSARIDVTDAGRRQLAADPAQALTKALARLPASLRGQLDRAVERLTGWVAAARGQNAFGTCDACRYLQGGANATARAGGAYCRMVAAYLDGHDMRGLCALYVPAGAR